MRKPLSLYIHIPFCNSKCAYCNFVSKVGSVSEKTRYVENLLEEIRMRAKEFNPRYEIATIYIGGGTPSCLPDGTISKILNEVYSKFTVRNQAEITVEVNPESFTREKAIEFSRSGINRISIGLQSAEPSILKLMGRKHTFADFENAVKIAKSVGISNISADIILGYPTQKQLDVKDTLSKLIKLDIPHISAYMLSVEDGTKLSKLVSEHALSVPTEKDTILMYQTTVKMLQEAGYVRYELSNFAKVGFRSRHNECYWNRDEYLGLGASAHSFAAGVRFANLESISDYNERIEALKLPVETAEKISTEEAKEEFVMLSLRLKDGMDIEKYKKEFGEDFLKEKKEKIAALAKLGLLILDGNNLKATDSGFLVLNRIILELV